MQIIAGWWHQHHHWPDASAICQDSNSSVKVMTAPGLMTEKMTVTLTTGWRLSQDGNVSQFMKSAMIRAFWGHRLSFHPRVEFKAAISADSVSLSSVVMDLVIRHVSSMMLMLTITNRDQTRRKKLLKLPNQSLSSGATELLLWRSKLILVFMILAVLWISWPCNARLWETIDQKRKKPYKMQAIQKITKIVFGDWSKLPGNHKPFPHLGRRRIQICKKNF